MKEINIWIIRLSKEDLSHQGGQVIPSPMRVQIEWKCGEGRVLFLLELGHPSSLARNRSSWSPDFQVLGHAPVPSPRLLRTLALDWIIHLAFLECQFADDISQPLQSHEPILIINLFLYTFLVLFLWRTMANTTESNKKAEIQRRLRWKIIKTQARQWWWQMREEDGARDTWKEESVEMMGWITPGWLLAVRVDCEQRMEKLE